LNSDTHKSAGQAILLLSAIFFFWKPVVAQDSTRQQIVIHFQADTRSVEAKTGSDIWYGDDKIRHLVGSFFSTTLLTQLAYRNGWHKKESKVFAMGTTMSLGFVKELYDRRKPGNHFCWKDLAADAAGIFIGLVVSGIK
jgi:uncharacterized protein YfiM (DUF2279 family)